MGFSVRLAPGIRVSASTRGVRTSLGPRVARVHVGSGRSGFSTGVGPVSYYTSVGGSGRRRTTSGATSASRQLAAARAVQARQEKADEAQRLQQAIDAIDRIHHENFDPATKPVASPPPTADRATLTRPHLAEARRATSVFARTARKAALAEARRRGEVDATQQEAAWEIERADWQQRLDAEWSLLSANDPAVVLDTLRDAFADNQAPAAAVGVNGDEIHVLVVVPPTGALPERRPTLTQAGNLSLKKLTKTESADLYKRLICGHVLVTVKEALAVAPAIGRVSAVAVRPAVADPYGRINPEVLIAVTFERSRLGGVRWREAEAIRILNDTASTRIFNERGATKELAPVDLSGEPELSRLAAAIDFGDMLGG